MPNLSISDTTGERNVIEQLLSEFEVPETLLPPDLSTFGDLIEHEEDSAFYIKPNCPPNEELAIRLLLQIVRQRSYDILTEVDIREVEDEHHAVLKADRADRINLQIGNARGALKLIIESLYMQEGLVDEDVFEQLMLVSEQIEEYPRNNKGAKEQHLQHIAEYINNFLTTLNQEAQELNKHNINGLRQALDAIQRIRHEDQLFSSRPTHENLIEQQQASARSLRLIFNEIPALQEVGRNLWDRNVDNAWQSKFLYALSQDENAAPIPVYNGLHCRPYGNVVDAASLIKTSANKTILAPRIIEALNTHNLRGFRQISGDGHCYYRALIIGILERLVLCEGPERHARFSYLATQFEQLLTERMLPHDLIPDTRDVIRVLKDAAVDNALIRVQDLEQFLTTYDLALVRIMRYALANATRCNLDTNNPGGLTISQSLEQSPDDYLQVILGMDQYAQGPSVDACLLNTVLGANIHTCLVDMGQNVSTTNSKPNFKGGFVHGYEPLPVYLKFSPQHYDLFQTTETFDGLKRAERLQRRAIPIADHSHLRDNKTKENTAVVHSKENLTEREALTSLHAVSYPRSINSTPALRPANTSQDVVVAPTVKTEPDPKIASTTEPMPSTPSTPLLQKPNHTFMLSVFAARPASSTIGVLLFLGGMALLGAFSFGAIPLAMGVSSGVICLATSLGLFAYGNNKKQEDEAQQATPKKMA